MSQNQPDRAFDMPADDHVLTDGDVEAIAEATATRLAEIVRSAPGTFALVDARQLAKDLGVSLDYVYAHATELGAMRLGSGPKALPVAVGYENAWSSVARGLVASVLGPFDQARDVHREDTSSLRKMFRKWVSIV
jgi:hypothetical protein